MPRKLKGIRPQGKKWEVYVRVSGRLFTKTFDELDIPRMRAWQEQQRASWAAPKRQQDSLLADVEAYLDKPKVDAMPSVHQRRAHLALWVEALGGDRRRDAITSDDVEAVLQRWLSAGLSEATVYHRRTALSALYTTMDGPSARNPVRGTTRPAHWTPRDQSVDRATLLRILDAMPDERRPMTGIRQPSAARLVVRVLMETGVRGADLLRLTRRDIDWTAGTIAMPRSSKGKGAPSWTCVLTPEGLEALRAFDQANLYGAFCLPAVSHSFKRAARRVLGQDTAVHLYALRHSVGADLYRTTRDLATVGRLLGHTTGSPMTAQYARGAHEDVDRAAIAALVASRAPQAAPKRTTVGKKVGSRRKFRIVKQLQRV